MATAFQSSRAWLRSRGMRGSWGIVRLGHMMPVDQAGLITLRGRAMSAPAEALIEKVKAAALDM